MTIRDELSVELKDALRAGDRNRKDVIRAIETEVSRAKSEPGFEGDIDDDLYRTVIASYVKKMTKARGEYEAMGDRGEEMVAKLTYETEFLARWMPQTLDEAATRALVFEAITELSVDDPKQAGRVVGHIMQDHKGEVDGGLVNKLVRTALES
ncbi:MAG: GatB/YqeY domain-containing protein [Acidimicrobiia bacterium]|nr:GatB/YqeY domain-containing protein [Acidimicrobiia bacterium]